MMPVGAISFIVHACIVMIKGIKKKLGIKRREVYSKNESPLIVRIIIPLFLLLLFMVAVISIVYDNARSQTSNVQLINLATEECKDFENEEKDFKVVLRVDDIQANAWRDVQMQMISDAQEYKMPLSLAIIPLKLNSDPLISFFLRKKSCNLEFMLHGYDNSFEEYKELSYEQAFVKTQNGKNILREELKIEGDEPVSFVPPNNVLSKEAEKAVFDLEFKLISAGFGESDYDFGSSTYDFELLEPVPPEQVLNECRADFAEKGYCIIMIHPQDFVDEDGDIDWDIYDEHYIKLLDRLESISNLEVVMMKEILE